MIFNKFSSFQILAWLRTGKSRFTRRFRATPENPAQGATRQAAAGIDWLTLRCAPFHGPVAAKGRFN